MARTAQSIQVEIEKLRKAMGTGALRVRYADRDVTYRSYAEMRQALADLEAELIDAGGGYRTRRVIFQTGKGL